jgi:hypothetical protein
MTIARRSFPEWLALTIMQRLLTSPRSLNRTNVNVCTTNDLTKSIEAIVYYIVQKNKEKEIAYSTYSSIVTLRTDGARFAASWL